MHIKSNETTKVYHIRDSCPNSHNENVRFSVKKRVFSVMTTLKCWGKICLLYYQMEKEEHHQIQGQGSNQLKGSPTFIVDYNNGIPALGGSVKLPFDDKAMKHFGLTEDIILNAIKGFLPGTYDRYQLVLTNVFCQWTPVSIRLADVSGEKKYFSVWKFFNEFPRPIKVTPVTRVVRKKSTSSSWSQQTSFGLSYETTVGASVGFVSAETTIGASINASWGKSETVEESVEFGSQASAQIELNPNEGVETILQLNTGQAKAIITYQLRIAGKMLVGYANDPLPISKHKFIEEEQYKTKLSTTRQVEQSIDIDSFGDGTVVVKSLGAKEKQ